MTTFRNIAAQLFAAMFLVVVTGVPNWNMPCCDSEEMDCCSVPEKATNDPCCTPVITINLLHVEGALAALPTLPVPLCATLLEAAQAPTWLDLCLDDSIPKHRAERCGPLIPPPLSLLEKFLI